MYVKERQLRSQTKKCKGENRSLRRQAPIRCAMKVKVISIIALCVMACFSPVVNAAENTITKTEIFHSESSDFHYSFENEIEENGRSLKLENVEYKVISQKEEMRNEHETTTEMIENLYDQKYNMNEPLTLLDIPATKTITVNGKEYEAGLENLTYEAMTIRNRKTIASTTIKVTEEELSNTIEYEYDDQLGKQKVKVILPMVSQKETEEVVSVNTVFPVIFHRYDSGVFLINNKLIPVQPGINPVSDEFYSDVKAESVYADAAGIITELVWDGEPYIVDGETRRNASATLTEERKLYEVNYSAEIDLPDTDGYRAILTYGTDIQKPTGKITYEVQAIAQYEPINNQTINPALFIGIGIAILALLIAVVLFIIAKRKKQKQPKS